MSIQLKINSSITLFALQNRSGNETIEALVVSGEKIKFTVYNEGAGDVTLRIKDSFSKDVPYRTVKTLIQSGPGYKDFLINDFHNNLVLELESVGTNKCSVGASIKSEVEAGVFSTQEQVNELNRLVPKFYDDAEVLSETPKKQPILIAFRAGGITIRTIQITYVNEIFKRVQVL